MNYMRKYMQVLCHKICAQQIFFLFFLPSLLFLLRGSPLGSDLHNVHSCGSLLQPSPYYLFWDLRSGYKGSELLSTLQVSEDTVEICFPRIYSILRKGDYLKIYSTWQLLNTFAFLTYFVVSGVPRMVTGTANILPVWLFVL